MSLYVFKSGKKAIIQHYVFLTYKNNEKNNGIYKWNVSQHKYLHKTLNLEAINSACNDNTSTSGNHIY